MDIENRLEVATEYGFGGGMEQEVWVSTCKLSYIEWIHSKDLHTMHYFNPFKSKVLLHSTENYIQYPMKNHNGKEYKKEYIIKEYKNV